MKGETDTMLVVVDSRDKEHAMELAEQNGVHARIAPARGFEPVTTTTLLLMGAASAVATVVYLIDKEKGGQIIDLRQGAVKSFYRTNDVAYGLVVVIAKDGSATVEVKEPKGMFGVVVQALMEVMVGLGDKEIKAAASAAEAVVGDSATVAIDQ